MPCLAEKARPWIARDGHSSNLIGVRPRGFGHVAQRFGREARAMLDAIEAFLLGGGKQSAIGDECRTRIGVIGIYSYYSVHLNYLLIVTQCESPDYLVDYHLGAIPADWPRKK